LSLVVLYTVHFTAFCLGGGRFFPDTVYIITTWLKVNIATKHKIIITLSQR